MTDVSLRDHVQTLLAALESRLERQMAEVHGELRAADRLEQERISALQREMTLRSEASAEAIAKAEAATERRFEGVNEFRAQLAEQAASFLPREVYDGTVASWTQWRETVEARLAASLGQETGARRVREAGRLTLGAMVGVVTAAVAVLGLVVVLANAFTN